MNANYLGRGPLAWLKHWFHRIHQHDEEIDRSMGLGQHAPKSVRLLDNGYEDFIYPNGDLVKFKDGRQIAISPVNQRNIWIYTQERS